MKYHKVKWELASCVGTDWRFFYADGDGGFVAGESKGINNVIRRICAECPIVNDCGTYAIEHEPHGFWAGMAEDHRRDVRNGRKNQPFAA